MRISDWSSDVCSSDLQSGNDGHSSREVKGAEEISKGAGTITICPARNYEAAMVLKIGFSSLCEGIREMSKMPVLFIGHGSPMNTLEDNGYTVAWRAFGKMIPTPKAILSISARSEQRRVGKESVSTSRSRGWRYN